MSLLPDGKKISFVRCYYRNDEDYSLWIADATDGKTNKNWFRVRISPARKTVVVEQGRWLQDAVLIKGLC